MCTLMISTETLLMAIRTGPGHIAAAVHDGLIIATI